MSNSTTLISMNEVCKLTSLSRTQINIYRNAGKFPAAVPLGVGRIAFVKSEVTAWIDDRINARNTLNKKVEAVT